MAKVKRRVPPDIAKEKKKEKSPRRSSVISDFTLPTERSAVHTSLSDYSILLFGDKKIGKTTLSAQFPNAYHMMFEPGGKALKIFQSAFDSWRDFIKAVQLLKDDIRFDNVVIDTVDLAFGQASGAACKHLGIDDPADAEWGKGWRATRKEFEIPMQKLLANKGVIFVSHAHMIEVTPRNGSKYNTLTSTMPGQARNIIEGVVDIWACYTYEHKRRVLIIEGDEDIAAGHRLVDNFHYDNGDPIRAIPMGTSAEVGYRNLVRAFNNELPKPKKKKKVRTS